MLTIKKRTEKYDYIYNGETLGRVDRGIGNGVYIDLNPEDIPFVIGVLERYQKDAKHLEGLVKDLKAPTEENAAEETPKKAPRKRAAKKTEE